jgi:hypothetical protein
MDVFQTLRSSQNKLFSALIALLIIFSQTPAVAQCTWGNYNGAYMCRCPDGNFANYVNGQIVCPDQGIHCGGGRYCQHGTQCCLSHNQCCGAGNFCSNVGCIPAGAHVCSNGTWCNPGHKCWTFSGQMKCISEQEDHARRHAQNVLDWLKKHNASAISADFERRHQKALEYVRDNQEVRATLLKFFASKGYFERAIGEKATRILMLTIDGAKDIDDFRHGRYYEGVLGITNQSSSILLTELLPYGGTMADVLNISGSIGTAYAYGFFWGQ